MAIRFPTKQEMRGRLKVLRRKTALLGWGSLAAAIVWALDGWSRLDLAWSIARQAWEVSGPFAQIFLDAVLTPLGLGLFGLGWLTLLVVRPVVKSHSDVAHAGARVSLSSSWGQRRNSDHRHKSRRYCHLRRKRQNRKRDSLSRISFAISRMGLAHWHVFNSLGCEAA